MTDSPRRTHYSDEQKAEALVALDANGGNVSRTARDTGLPYGTIRAWRDRGVPEAVAQLHHEKRAPLADRLEALAHSLIDDLGDEARRIGNVSQVAVALGIAIDKARLLRGESTAITETRTVDDRRADILGKLRRVSAN